MIAKQAVLENRERPAAPGRAIIGDNFWIGSSFPVRDGCQLRLDLRVHRKESEHCGQNVRTWVQSKRAAEAALTVSLSQERTFAVH
jgi:hypothetical protein